jgi:hypothetical protein
VIKRKYVTRNSYVSDESSEIETDDCYEHLHSPASSFGFRPILRPWRLTGVKVNNSFHVPRDEVLCYLDTVAFPVTMSPYSPSLLHVHCEQRVLPTLKC